MHLDFKRGCSFINLTWNPPSRDVEGGMVTGYLAQIKAASSEGPWTTKNVSQSTQSCLFTHLKPNSEYHVRVMAQDKMGYGWPSEVSRVSTILWRSIAAKIQCSILHCTLHNLSYILCLAFEFALAIQLFCIQHSTLIYATFKFSLSTFNFSKATVRFWNSTFKFSGMYIHFLSSNI